MFDNKLRAKYMIYISNFNKQYVYAIYKKIFQYIVINMTNDNIILLL